jgi:hypothetical protein
VGLERVEVVVGQFVDEAVQDDFEVGCLCVKYKKAARGAG